MRKLISNMFTHQSSQVSLLYDKWKVFFSLGCDNDNKHFLQTACQTSYHITYTNTQIRSFRNIKVTKANVKGEQQEETKNDKIKACNPIQSNTPLFGAMQSRKQALQVLQKRSFCTPRKTEHGLPFQTIALFSVDQIREKESPWKALTELDLNASEKQQTDRPVKRSSPFKQRLQERKKVCMLYGNLPKRSLDRYLKGISRPEDVILLLESRLDIVLKRSSFFPCIPSARKAILQGNISVNQQVVRSPKYHCTPGDLIKVLEKKITQNPSKNAQKSINVFNITHTQSQSQLQACQKKVFDLSDFSEWNNVFVFSETLKVWDRKVGRLHTSALNTKKDRVSKTYETSFLTGSDFSLRTRKVFVMPLHEPIVNRDKKFEKNTKNPQTFEHKQSLCDTSSKTLLHNKNSVSLTKKQISNTNHLFAGERAEWDLPLSREVGSRPLHLEVSYRDLCVIFLYPPQRVCVDISINLSMLH